VTNLKEGFKARIRSIIAGLKGKRSSRKNIKHRREDSWAPTKEYRCTTPKMPLEEWGKQGVSPDKSGDDYAPARVLGGEGHELPS
jgi:hypothetical protein